MSRFVAAQASLDLSGLAPGTYTASAVLARDGQPFARVSRLVEVVPGEATPAPAPADVTNAPSPRSAARTVRDPALEDVLQRVGRYVAKYGEQASLIIAVERERHEAPAILARLPNRVIVPDAVVTATATYGEFKRFETSTSISDT